MAADAMASWVVKVISSYVIVFFKRWFQQITSSQCLLMRENAKIFDVLKTNSTRKDKIVIAKNVFDYVNHNNLM